MNKTCITAALMLMCLLGVGASAHAQDAESVVVSVPFEFVAGGATLPAGDYRISHVNPGTNRELAINGYKEGHAFLLPLGFDDGPTSLPTLSFEHVGGKYFLSKIRTLEGVYTLPASREMVMLGKANAPNHGTSSASGGQ
jgi:hypothetical protein